MLELDPVQDRGGIDVVGPVQGHEVRRVAVDALQAVEVVGDGRAGARGLLVVPRRPRRPPAGEERGVGVQHRVVGRVGEGAEEVLLQLVGVLEQGEGLVGVGGDDDAVEPADPVVGGAHVDAVVGPTDRAHAAAGVDAVAEPRPQGEHVLMAPTDDGAPLLPPEPEHAVVVEEPDGVGGGEVEHLVGCRRPERRGDRHEELADEPVAVALVGDVLAQARLARGRHRRATASRCAASGRSPATARGTTGGAGAPDRPADACSSRRATRRARRPRTTSPSGGS